MELNNRIQNQNVSFFSSLDEFEFGAGKKDAKFFFHSFAPIFRFPYVESHQELSFNSLIVFDESTIILYSISDSIQSICKCFIMSDILLWHKLDCKLA